MIDKEKVGFEISQNKIGEKYMEKISKKMSQVLLQEYGLDVQQVRQMTTGVGGDTYLVQTSRDKFIYKIADANEINHPEAEPEICNFLFEKGIEVSDFLKNKSGHFVTPYDDKRVSHVQKYIEGKVFPMNTAPEWFMIQTPTLLGRIHNELRDYKELPMGIGKEFFKYMTPDSARQSYLHSYETAKQIDETEIIEDLEFRLQIIGKMSDWNFDLSKLTYCNSHGDYTINQIICGENKVNAVIDWTCACMQPVIWEITRSFYMAEPTCSNGKLNESNFRDYVDGYCSIAPLTQYDRDNLLRLYYYQIAVCDYYSQYLSADPHKKDEYLLQAKFATNVLKNSDII